MDHSLRLTFRCALVSSAIWAAACGATADSEHPVQAIQDRLTLEPFSDCAALEAYIEDTAIRDMRQQIDQTVAYGWYGWAVEDVVPSTAGPAKSGSSSPSPAAFTKTNTQVAGVDEADFVKNDGTRIFVLSGSRLIAARSWPPQDLSLAGSLTVEGYPREMFLDEKNRIVVISDVYASFLGSATFEGDVRCGAYGCGSTNAAKLTVVDVADLAAMKVVSETYLPGFYRFSRRIGPSVRVVTSDSFRWPQGLVWYPQYDPNNPSLYQDTQALQRWGAMAKLANEARIRAASLSDWLPKGQRRVAGGSLVELGYGCQDFHHANAPVRLGIATVATVNLDTPDAQPSRTSIVGEVGQIYASTTSLYLASWHWWWWPMPGQSDYTYLHKLDISQPDRAVYVASGGVEGHIVDQFSMDEDRGTLRVATTISTTMADASNPRNIWGTQSYTNRVSVLGEREGMLQVVGKTGELSKGERVYSSRFIGDKGFVVTFRQIDPLFTLDMSDPTAPKVVGSLKVPGFSTYIHPVDDNHLLTIGIDVPDPATVGAPVERRVKLSLFDVTDFANPREAFTQVVGTAYGWSEATYEHKAFNYFPEKKLLAIPFSDWSSTSTGSYWDSFVSELRIFEIDTAKGITPKGAMSMNDVYSANTQYSWDWWYSPWIRRSVMASDDAEQTFVYAVSDAGIRVSNLATVSEPLRTAIIPPQAPELSSY